MQTAAENAVGLDVGGTRIRAARISQDGEVIDRVIEKVCADRAGFTAQVLRLIETVRNDASCAVGIGIPGRVNGANGAILSAGYIDAAGLDLPQLIAAQTGLPAQIENDAMMALVAEGHRRRNDPDGSAGLIAMMTVGTGIGGALLLDNQPWHGGGVAGQFGHLVVAEDGPLCNCGRRGCVETFSSGTALGRLIAQAGLPSSTHAQDLFDAAEAGDETARTILRTWASPFRRAAETLVAALNPKRVIVGGGLGAEMVRALGALDGQSPWFPLPIEAARLGDDAGVIGAGLTGFTAAKEAL